MIDQFGRDIHYLRLSVTDRCNLRCMYCSPGNQKDCVRLSAEEFIRVVRIMAGLGIQKVRLTGGEPLIRQDLEQIIAGIAAIGTIQDIPMTTNATRLAGRLDGLTAAGLTRLNISLDTLRPDRYKQITGSDALSTVLEGIEAALDKGLNVKINAVLVRGLNDDEVDDLIALGKNKNLSIRFIEMMPIGNYAEHHVSERILNTELLASHPMLKAIGKDSGGVAEVYRMPGYIGTVGFISALSHQFCSSCNRIRLTCDGKIKPCLGNNGETDILPILRGGGDLEACIRDAIFHKPAGHHFQNPEGLARDMRATGG